MCVLHEGLGVISHDCSGFRRAFNVVLLIDSINILNRNRSQEAKLTNVGSLDS